MPCPEKFRETLAQFHIADSVIRQIEDGYEGKCIVPGSSCSVLAPSPFDRIYHQ